MARQGGPGSTGCPLALVTRTLIVTVCKAIVVGVVEVKPGGPYGDSDWR